MTHLKSPAELVIHLAELYHRGVICPTETWHKINEANNECELVPLLNSLNDQHQALVRTIHNERPGSLESLSDKYPESEFPMILNWCLKTSSQSE